MSLNNSFDHSQIIANSYYNAALANDNMRRVTDSLESIRLVLHSNDIFEVWNTIDDLIGQSETDILQEILVSLRDEFQEQFIKIELDKVYQHFEQNNEIGWKYWIRTYTKGLIHWRLPLCLALVNESFNFPKGKNEDAEKIKKLSIHILYEQWTEACPVYSFLIEQNFLPVNHRAKLLVTAGEIQLYHLLNLDKANDLFTKAKELSADDGRVICGLGEYCLQKNEFAKAREYFQEAINADPHLADGYLFMGDCYLKENKLNIAEDYYQDAIRMSAGDSGGYLRLIRLYGQQSLFQSHENRIFPLVKKAIAVDPYCEYTACLDVGYANELNNNTREAFSWYDKAVKLNPSRITAYLSKGYLYLSKENYTEAVTQFEKAIELAPEVFDGYWALTWLFEKENKLESAIDLYYKCIELRPEWEAIIRDKIGDVKLKLNDLPGAELELTKSIQIDKNNAPGLHNVYKLADQYYKHQDDNSNAIRIYRKIRKILGDSHEAEYQNNVGNVHYYTENYPEAAVCFRKAAEINPDSSVYHANLADALMNMGNLQGAKESYLKAIDLNPANDEYINILGNIYYQSENYQTATEWYKKAIEIDPIKPVYHANLGLSYRNLQQWAEAEYSYKKALELDPENSEYLNMLGVIYYGMNQDHQAIDYYIKAIEKEPDNSIFYANLGLAYRTLGDLNKSEHWYGKALEIDADNPDYMNSIANVYIMMNDNMKAVDWLLRAIENQPGNAEYQINLGLAYQNLGNLEEAEKAYRKAVKINPETADNWNNLGLIYFKRSDYLKSREYFDKAKEIAPEVAIYHANSGLASELLGDWLKAEQAYLKAIDLEPENAENWNNIGILYVNKQEFEKAAENYLKAIEINSDVAIYRNNLYSACEKIDDKEKLKATLASLPENVLAEFWPLVENTDRGTSDWRKADEEIKSILKIPDENKPTDRTSEM